MKQNNHGGRGDDRESTVDPRCAGHPPAVVHEPVLDSTDCPCPSMLTSAMCRRDDRQRPPNDRENSGDCARDSEQDHSEARSDFGLDVEVGDAHAKEAIGLARRSFQPGTPPGRGSAIETASRKERNLTLHQPGVEVVGLQELHGHRPWLTVYEDTVNAPCLPKRSCAEERRCCSPHRGCGVCRRQCRLVHVLPPSDQSSFILMHRQQQRLCHERGTSVSSRKCPVAGPPMDVGRSVGAVASHSSSARRTLSHIAGPRSFAVDARHTNASRRTRCRRSAVDVARPYCQTTFRRPYASHVE
jgi:hypothetical protein